MGICLHREWFGVLREVISRGFGDDTVRLQGRIVMEILSRCVGCTVSGWGLWTTAKEAQAFFRARRRKLDKIMLVLVRNVKKRTQKFEPIAFQVKKAHGVIFFVDIKKVGVRLIDHVFALLLTRNMGESGTIYLWGIWIVRDLGENAAQLVPKIHESFLFFPRNTSK